MITEEASVHAGATLYVYTYTYTYECTGIKLSIRIVICYIYINIKPFPDLKHPPNPEHELFHKRELRIAGLGGVEYYSRSQKVGR